MLVDEGVVKVTSLLVWVKVHLGSVFGDRAWTEMKMWCVRPMLHTANSHECMGIIGEALQLHSLYKVEFSYKSFEYCDPNFENCINAHNVFSMSLCYN